MRLAHRVQKLEKTELLVRSRPVMERYARALDEAAFTVAGKDFNSISGDRGLLDRVFDTVQESFVQKLSDADLEVLCAEMERLAFGDDVAALERTKREVVGLAALERPRTIDPSEPDGW